MPRAEHKQKYVCCVAKIESENDNVLQNAKYQYIFILDLVHRFNLTCTACYARRTSYQALAN